MDLANFGILAADGDIFGVARGWMETIYGAVAGVTLLAAGCAAAVCLFLIIFSKNQKTVEQSVSWLKRIAIGSIALLSLGAILKFITGELKVTKEAKLDV